MRTTVASGALMLLALGVLTAGVPRERQASTARSGRKSQEQEELSARVPANAGHRKIPCKTSENAAMCYWAHGRLAAGSGNPTFRIWRIGTHRMLGVFNGPSPRPPSFLDEENPEFPASLNKVYNAYNRRMKQELGYIGAVPPPAYADFEVCPLEPEREGWMQPVCIESAKNIVIPIDY